MDEELVVAERWDELAEICIAQIYVAGWRLAKIDMTPFPIADIMIAAYHSNITPAHYATLHSAAFSPLIWLERHGRTQEADRYCRKYPIHAMRARQTAIKYKSDHRWEWERWLSDATRVDMTPYQPYADAHEIYALTVLLCDDYFRLVRNKPPVLEWCEPTTRDYEAAVIRAQILQHQKHPRGAGLLENYITPMRRTNDPQREAAYHFWRIVMRLPMEMQERVCSAMVRNNRTIIIPDWHWRKVMGPPPMLKKMLAVPMPKYSVEDYFFSVSSGLM